MNYPYFNPYQYVPQMAAQGRPVQMGQVYPEQQNAPQAANMGQTQGISPASRPVSSKEEEMAVGADFSGAPMIFPDMAHDTIYVKRWDFQSGSAVFTEYVPKESVPEAPAAVYATQGDFKELAEKLADRLDDIEADLERLKKKGAKRNDDE